MNNIKLSNSIDIQDYINQYNNDTWNTTVVDNGSEFTIYLYGQTCKLPIHECTINNLNQLIEFTKLKSEYLLSIKTTASQIAKQVYNTNTNQIKALKDKKLNKLEDEIERYISDQTFFDNSSILTISNDIRMDHIGPYEEIVFLVNNNQFIVKKYNNNKCQIT